jgi:hypothetical protein
MRVFLSAHVNIKAIAAKKDGGGGECDPLVAVEKAVVIGESLHQRGSFFDGVVIARLRTEAASGLPLYIYISP